MKVRNNEFVSGWVMSKIDNLFFDFDVKNKNNLPLVFDYLNNRLLLSDYLDTHNFADLLDNYFEDNLNFILDYSDNNDLINIFLLNGDIHNEKEKIKYELDKIDPTFTKVCSREGSFLTNDNEFYIKNDFLKNKSISRIDLYIEKIGYEKMLDMAKKSKNQNVIDYVRSFIDFRNYNLFFRNKHNFQEFKIDGGNIELYNFVHLDNLEMELNIDKNNYNLLNLIEISFLMKKVKKMWYDSPDSSSHVLAYALTLYKRVMTFKTVIEINKLHLPFENGFDDYLIDIFE